MADEHWLFKPDGQILGPYKNAGPFLDIANPGDQLYAHSAIKQNFVWFEWTKPAEDDERGMYWRDLEEHEVKPEFLLKVMLSGI